MVRRGCDAANGGILHDCRSCFAGRCIWAGRGIPSAAHPPWLCRGRLIPARPVPVKAGDCEGGDSTRFPLISCLSPLPEATLAARGTRGHGRPERAATCACISSLQGEARCLRCCLGALQMSRPPPPAAAPLPLLPLPQPAGEVGAAGMEPAVQAARDHVPAQPVSALQHLGVARSHVQLAGEQVLCVGSAFCDAAHTAVAAARLRLGWEQPQQRQQEPPPQEQQQVASSLQWQREQRQPWGQHQQQRMPHRWAPACPWHTHLAAATAGAVGRAHVRQALWLLLTAGGQGWAVLLAGLLAAQPRRHRSLACRFSCRSPASTAASTGQTVIAGAGPARLLCPPARQWAPCRQ